MAKLNTYLNFMGNTEEAFLFYKSVFGGEFQMLQRMKDTPDGGKLSEKEQNLVMHVALPIGKDSLLMGTDMLESMGHKFIPGNNISISIEAESKEEAEKLYAGLSEGAQIEMPLTDMFWGAWFAAFADKFGVRWMINYSYKK